ncbi:penicillin acylase family protein [Xanthovirga aplysinae]|uniref:penicillin acylase family protein n=1 Tax=Xanthovirga aplysinae TaxID=2529853 RepID=UPI0012BD156E|nr:penicillin acylase family protein [Xanthovirga aplysinae]MTI30943.1 penicillin acylase family protein [Xanthovirga aplysinae]
MKIVRLSLSLLFTLGLLILFSIKIGDVPPLGYFLNPFTGFWHNAETEKGPELSSLKIDGLKDKVSIYYDEQLIPHIFATNDEDAYLAQGYVTAALRLWQMDFQTMAAAGRVSEIVGKKALDFDRLQRRKGMVYGAKNKIKSLNSHNESLMALEAYAKGVNAYIDNLFYRDLPLEYKLLGYRPEKWTPLKSSLLMMYMADDLSGEDKDLENTNVLKLLGKENFELLFPEVPKDLDPVIPKGTRWNFKPAPIKKEAIIIPEGYISKIPTQPLENLASNNWAISPKKSANGSTILANDPHLSFNLPSIWFVLQLHSPEMNVFGASLPGAPGIIIGFNDSIAWGVTNAKRDVRDWYQIKFRDEHKEQYAYDDKWLQSTKKIEEIKIRGENSFIDTVVYTHYGPVVYDEHFTGKLKQQNFALRWTAHDPSNELLSFKMLNKAQNYEDYLNALTHYQSPAQNFAFASANGDIAMGVQGKFVNKWPGQGKFLMDGSQSSQEWQGFIPQNHNANVKNPPRGYISSANQYPVDITYPYYIYDYIYENYRNRQINQRLNEMENISVEDMMLLQNDNFNLKASESLPLFLNLLDTNIISNPALENKQILEDWNYYNNADEKAPSIYGSWWRHLYASIWDEFDVDNLALYKPQAYNTIELMKKDPEHVFFDVLATPEVETLKDLLQDSFEKATDELTGWKKENEKDFEWGDYRKIRIQHLARLEPLSVYTRSGGGKHIVNATQGHRGPSWRMIVKFGEELKAWGVYPGGQSGNPGSPFYANLVDKWSQGEYYPLQLLQVGDTAKMDFHFNQTLKPATQ